MQKFQNSSKQQKKPEICIIDGEYWVKATISHIDRKRFKVRKVKIKDIGKTDFSGFAGFIITGSLLNLTEMDRGQCKKLFGFLNDTSKPVLGVCFGHQLFGYMNGAKISRMTLTNKMEKINFVRRADLFKGVKNHSLFRVKHYEHIGVPKNFVLLAKSASCQNEAMKHKTKNIYGLQFHPEVSGKNGKMILKNFLKLCK